MIKKFFSLLFALLLFCSIFFSLTINSFATEDVSNAGFKVEENAGAVYLYNYESDRVLFSQKSQEHIVPASTAKMMAGLLVCELYKHKLDDAVTIEAEMLNGCEGASMNLIPGMTVTVRDLLLGTLCGGNNDAAQVLAIACAGSIKAFVVEMNTFAKRMYMNDTVYKNPTGLDALGAVTTLSDTARLAHRAAQNELYLSISSLSSFEFSPQGAESATIYNRNALISQFSATGYTNKYAKGLIAGNTDEGGYVLATYAQKDGSSYLCVIMGAQAIEGRIYSYLTANKLLDVAFREYSFVRIAKMGDVFLNQPLDFAVKNGESIQAYCVLSQDVSAFLNSDVDIKKEVTYKAYLHDKKLDAPLNAGDIVGGVNFYHNGALIARAPLIVNETVEGNSILMFFDSAKNVLFSRFALLGIIISIATISFYLFLSEKNARYKKVGTVRFNKFS